MLPTSFWDVRKVRATGMQGSEKRLASFLSFSLALPLSFFFLRSFFLPFFFSSFLPSFSFLSLFYLFLPFFFSFFKIAIKVKRVNGHHPLWILCSRKCHTIWETKPTLSRISLNLLNEQGRCWEQFGYYKIEAKDIVVMRQWERSSECS